MIESNKKEVVFLSTVINSKVDSRFTFLLSNGMKSGLVDDSKTSKYFIP